MALTECVSDSFGGRKGTECIKGLDESHTFFFDCIRHKENSESTTPTRHGGKPKDRQTNRQREKRVETV